MSRLLSLLVVLLVAAPVSAQRIRGSHGEYHHRVEPGQTTYALHDSTQIKGTAADTSQAFPIGACDYISLAAKYDNRADSMNVLASILIAASQQVALADYVAWGDIDTAIVSGAGDLNVYKSRSFPTWAAVGRLVLTGRHEATDSTKCTTKITRTVEGN